MSYSCRVFDSISAVALEDWQRVHSACGEPIFMDPRTLVAVEIGMRESSRFWHVIVYDKERHPVACASLSTTPLDLVNVASPLLALIVRRLPGLSKLRNLRVLFCGLPISAGQSSLMITSHCDSSSIVSTLDGVISEIASEMDTDMIVYKEFDSDDRKRINSLLNHGYQRVSSPPMHYFAPAFRDLQHYCAALKSRYRRNLQKSIRKLDESGVTISVLTEPEEILKAYQLEVHDLYNQVVKKADLKLEIIPIDFFRELATRLRGQVELIVLSKSSKIIASGWCLHAGSTYYLLFLGLDYNLNAELDLYFNLVYASLDRALHKGVAKIQVGQTASFFKARLGCYSEPRCVFMKGLGPLVSPLIRYGANLLVADVPAVAPFDIFSRMQQAQ